MGRNRVAKTGSDLRSARVDNYGASLREVSRAAGVAPSTVLRWERYGKLPRCQTWALRRIMMALRVRRSEDKELRSFRGPYGVKAPTRTAHEFCSAKTRSGGACKRRPLKDRSRCRLHGGLSTGPKTEARRARCAQAARERWNHIRKGEA